MNSLAIKFDQESYKELTPHQLNIFQSIISIVDSKVTAVLRSNNLEDYIISLQGPAGTGKTYLTAQLAKYFQSRQSHEFNFVITSPTHKASGVATQMLRDNNINAVCKTIHSFLGIKPFRDYEKGIEVFKVDKTKQNKDTTSILFVDESSMIGAELYSHIIEALQDGRVKFIIFVGDPYQLLPVDDSHNKIYSLKNQFHLTEVVRQAEDSYILKIATEVRKRIQNKNYIPLNELFTDYSHPRMELFYNQEEFIKNFYAHEKWYDEDKIIATHKNQDVDTFNKIIRTKYWEQRGVYNPVTLLQGDMLRFKEAYLSLYYNGQVVQLQSANFKHHDSLDIMYWECRTTYSSEQQIFRVVDPDSLKTYNDKLTAIADRAKRAYYPDKSRLWKTFYAVKDMFADVQYIYASTIHKLQGSTHDTTYIDLFSMINNPYMSNDEKYRLTYVAITRARYDIKVFMPKFLKNNTVNESKDVRVQERFDDIDNMLKKLFL